MVNEKTGNSPDATMDNAADPDMNEKNAINTAEMTEIPSEIPSETNAVAAKPRKSGRPKGSKNILSKAITVNATVIPARRGRKPKNGASSLTAGAEVVSVTPSRRGRKPKIAAVTVPVDTVVVAKIPAKRGRKPKISVSAVPGAAAKALKLPVKRGRKPKAVPSGYATASAAPAKRGRKPKITLAAAAFDAAAVSGIPAKRGRKPKASTAALPVDSTVSPAISREAWSQEAFMGNIEALLQRMTACMENTAKIMEILVRDSKKES